MAGQVSKTLIREQKVFATLPLVAGLLRFLLAVKLRNEFYPTSSAPPYDTKLSAKFHRSRSSWKRPEMREAATVLRYAETTSRMVILRGRAENRLVRSLFLSMFFSGSRPDEMYDSSESESRASRDTLFFGRVGYIKMQFSYLAYERL